MCLKYRFCYFKLTSINIDLIEFDLCNHRIHYSLL